ncbi:response regulator transcription factor [Nocardioides ferulae]|uniref:response regulator transcription factor n=1 Tax=Nocardioides ferulae TaxID=2340821 RepID=UPI0019801C9B|nr:response regulator transcription factor [Nocardioides ferulae]
MAEQVRVLIADDEGTIRAALAALLELEADLDVIAQAANGREAVELARRHRPDVAVLDLEMPDLDGIAVVAELHRAAPGCVTVVLSGRGRPAHLREALEAGAQAFVAKGAPAGTLADVIRGAQRGERYVDPTLAAEALTAPANPLTERELEVLRLAALDLPTAVIARRTHLATGTVRNYVAAATAKLGAESKGQAVAIARAQGWIR